MKHKGRQAKLWLVLMTGGIIGYHGSLFAAETKTTKTITSQTVSSKTISQKSDTTSTTNDVALEAMSNGANGATDAEIDFSNDPLERYNRAIFALNDLLDRYLVKPVATFYNAVMPKPLNTGVHNFFTNLNEITHIPNDILQLNAHQFANDTWRFVLNSTFGLAGFIDIATRMHLPYHANDFGLTLSKWGYQNSTYLVFPFLGPSTIRDTFGLAVDYYGFSVYPYIEPPATRVGVVTLFYIDQRASLLQFEPVFEEAAIDKYVFMRNAYMQHRQFNIEQVQSGGNMDDVVEATGEPQK